MKTNSRLLALTLLVTLSTWSLPAQTAGTPGAGTSTGGNATTGSTPPATGNSTTGGSTSPGGTTNPRGKGPAANASENAKAVHKVIADFQAQRDQYLAERKTLLEKLRTATETERKTILEQLRAENEKRADEERALGKQIREELKKLRDERKSAGS
jgi:ABC-type branched-subunit amino acid transport system ATPase component